MSLAIVSRAFCLDIKLPLETKTFKQVTGVDLANGKCLLCHSVEYVTMQPPMPRAFWKSSVVKMQKKFGAPITDAEVDPLADYLTLNYGLATNATQAIAPTPTAQNGQLTGEQVAAKYYCLACHSPTVKVGPPYAAVAAKYKNDPQAFAKISQQIHKGGSGKWGTTPMPAFETVTPDETKALAQWILSMK